MQPAPHHCATYHNAQKKGRRHLFRFSTSFQASAKLRSVRHSQTQPVQDAKTTGNIHRRLLLRQRVRHLENRSQGGLTSLQKANEAAHTALQKLIHGHERELIDRGISEDPWASPDSETNEFCRWHTSAGLVHYSFYEEPSCNQYVAVLKQAVDVDPSPPPSPWKRSESGSPDPWVRN
jgi:hypothetical protein